MTSTTNSAMMISSIAAATATATNYCDQQHKIIISPRRIVYKKRLRRRYLPGGGISVIYLILLILINEKQLFGTAIATGNNALLADEIQYNDDDGIITSSNSNSDNSNLNKTSSSNVSPPIVISSNIGGSGHYLDKIDNLERSVAAVLIKVAYGTTSTTKRSIPDNSYVPSLTTIATPPLTTLRYLEKSQHQQQINLHHRNYELDLERDHALPTSAPNADILKSNSNPTYPNPNRHHNHDRDRHRHLVNSTPSPIHNLQKKGPPTNPMYSIDMPSYSPPARSFLTPPLPPEYTNPFADKPTLRGTNNEGGGSGIANTGTYINRRPIPPPSLMPGQERIPLRPPDLNGSPNGSGTPDILPEQNGKTAAASYPEDGQRKKALNTPSQKVNNKIDSNSYDKHGVLNNVPQLDTAMASNETASNPAGGAGGGGLHFQGISRILLGSNGRKEDIPEVLLRTATVRPSYNSKPPTTPIKQSGSIDGGKNPNINQSKNNNGGDDGSSESRHSDAGNVGISDFVVKENDDGDGSPAENDSDDGGMTDDGEDDDFDMVVAAEPQPKIKLSTKSTENPNNDEDSYSTQFVHNLANINNEKSLLLTTSTPSGQASSNSNINGKDISGSSSTTTKTTGATWTVAWNIHVYLSAILFTILAVYSIFKMIFYDKLTHLFNQSYFICIHLILIIICMTRIFYLCYDAYNIHSTFHLFVSEILLNLPATFLTISFSVLILFLLIRSLNHKNNRYSALIRPLTVVVGSSVHVGLCVTLHYVESYTTTNNQQLYYYQQQLYRNGGRGSGISGNMAAGYNHHLLQPPPSPPRVLSLICQIIYIFVCLSLGLLYLYIYRILKRVLRSKSQNYIHGYQNLSYAIHITIATALLYVLLAALQIYGALSISTTRPLITSSSEIDWLQWGYQFSLRLIEIAIITLMSWVAGLKTGGNTGVLQREKTAADTHNVSGFALFPCTSSSSQEHFETDYPAVCNANTNLHTYTLRTGKPIYDDNFALNSLAGNSSGSGSQSNAQQQQQQRMPATNDFQIQNSGGDFVRSYETSSLRSVPHHLHNHSPQILDTQSGNHSDFLADPQTDHYENPNFELRSTGGQQQQDNCYSEPLNTHGSSAGHGMVPSASSGYDFQNFERPIFGGDRPNSRTESHHIPKSKTNTVTNRLNQQNTLDRTNYENPERRSSNSTHSCASSRNYSTYNSFERRNLGVRKSGTLNNIGSISQGNGCGGRNNSTSSSSSSSHRPSGIQTLTSTHNRTPNNNSRVQSSTNSANIIAAAVAGQKLQPTAFYRGAGSGVDRNHRSSLERSNSTAIHQQQYIIPSDDEICCNPERATLIKAGGAGAISNGSGGGGITSSTSGSNLTDSCLQQQHSQIPVAASSSSGDSATSGSMLVAEHGFVRFRALDDINNAQGVGIHNASIRTNSSRNKEKRCFTNNT